MKTSKWKIRRRLNRQGECIETSYLLYLNNLDPMTFPTREALADYLAKYRNENDIFTLHLCRVDVYSL